MMFSRTGSTLRRCAALAAAFGIALQALWPLIAQARPKDSVLVPICSADGVRHSIELPLGKTSDGTQHCKLCVLGTDKLGVINEVPAFVSFAGKFESIPGKASSSFKPSTVSTAQSRAPPKAS